MLCWHKLSITWDTDGQECYIDVVRSSVTSCCENVLIALDAACRYT